MSGPLVISNVSAGYGKRRVLDELSLAPIEPGKVTALVGPNAAGKSTLLRCVAGLVDAYGSVRLGELALPGMSSAERAQHVAFMPQTLPSGTELTVLDGVISALKASPLAQFEGNSRATDRALDALERLDVLDIAMESIGRLSGGQRQLASLAQAIVRAPELLLLDEPTSALDLRHQIDVMGMVRALAREGRIVVVVLHDLTLAATWADHLVILDRGRLAAQGAPEEALSGSILKSVYAVDARVERCSKGRLQVLVDGPAMETQHAS